MIDVSNVLIAIVKELSGDLESLLTGMRYTKEVTDHGDFYSFDYSEWNHPDDPWPSAIMTFLFSVVGMSNYAFVRMGEEATENEVHGDLESFGVSFIREVAY